MPDLIATTKLLERLEAPSSGDAPALKTSKNLWFSDIAKGSRNGTLDSNWLILIILGIDNGKVKWSHNLNL